MISDLQYKITPKTRFFNFFRRSLMIPFVENFIVDHSLKNPGYLWMKIIPPSYLYPKSSIRTVERNGFKFILDISNYVDHGLYFFGLQGKDFDCTLPYVKKSKVIFDIGAYKTTASLIFRSVNSEAQIHAFEPHPLTFKYAQEIASINNLTNFSLHNVGLGDRPGKFSLYEVVSSNAGMNRIINEKTDYPSREIDVVTIDDFAESNRIDMLDFIKIDAEGYEYNILKGGEKTLRKFMPALFIELDDNNLIDSGQSAKSLISLLASFGYNEFIKANSSEKIDINYNFRNCHFDILVTRQ